MSDEIYAGAEQLPAPDNETDAAIAAGLAMAGAKYVHPIDDLGGVPVVTVPAGAQAHVLDLERFLPAPRRATGRVTLRDLASFADYVDRHSSEATTLWIDRDAHAVTAVLNDHELDTPAWGDHRALLQLTLTEEWKRWVRLDGQLMPQDEFAALLEEGQREVVEPPAATMLELAETFYVRSSANFHSRYEMQSGAVKLRFDEDLQAGAGERGEMEIPREFRLALSPFVGEQPYDVRARLLFRVREQRLRLGFKLDRPEAVLDHALAGVARQLREGVGVVDETGEAVRQYSPFANVYMGAPRS